MHRSDGIDFVTRCDNRVLQRNIDEFKQGIQDLDDGKFLEMLQHPSEIHRRIFTNTLAENDKIYIGAIRGSSASLLSDDSYIGVKYGKDYIRLIRLIEAEKVPEYLHLYQELIQAVLAMDVSDSVYLVLLSQLSNLFLNIHPFVDGNGHVYRLIVRELSRRKDIYISERWRIEARPYNKSFTIAMINYELNPLMLCGILQEWVGNLAKAIDDGLAIS